MTAALSGSLYARTSQNPVLIASSRKVAHPVRVEHAPRLDGTLDDPLWRAAQPVADFFQREPFEGQRPTERTQVRMLYTRDEVYFGILCDDSDPRAIVATELRRDLPQYLDDYFEIAIDPTYGQRSAYVFEINPLGT